MKVALIGVPKTGKTKYAKTLNLKVIDNIPQKFSKQTGILIGENADFRVNMSLANLRWVEEAKVGDDFVSTTTIVDSMVYSARGTELFELPGVDDFSDLFVLPYYFTSLYLIFNFLKSWTYDKAIFFPYTGKDEKWVQIDQIYRRVLERMQIEHETFEPTTVGED